MKVVIYLFTIMKKTSDKVFTNTLFTHLIYFFLLEGGGGDYCTGGRVLHHCGVLPCMVLANLNKRTVSCVRCGQEGGRDHNAAHNIAQATLRWMSTHTVSLE
jgi:hypothetical protein